MRDMRECGGLRKNEGGDAIMIANNTSILDESQKIRDAIHYEVVQVHLRWTLYRQLYGASAERDKILQNSAPSFFSKLEEILLDDVQLSLSRLADKRKKTLKLELLEQGVHHARKQELQTKIADFREACKMICERRHNWIAHSNKQALLDYNITEPSRAEIEKALQALRDVMNCVLSDHIYDSLIIVGGDGDTLLSVLEEGIRYRELVSNGSIPHDDLYKDKAIQNCHAVA
jgi:AbiU2